MASNFFKTIILGIILFGMNVAAQAQVEEKLKKNSLKISPTAFAVSTIAISYERYLSQSLTLQITGGIMAATKKSDPNNNNSYYYYNNGYYNGNYYNNNNGTNYYKEKNKASGGLVEGVLKYYFVKGQSVMSGLYAGPYARYSKNSFEIQEYIYNPITTIYDPSTLKYSIESVEGGAVFGFQWVVKNAFVMDMYLGGGLKVSENTSPNTYNRSDRSFWILETQDYTGVTPKAGFRLGFVF